MPGVDIFHDPHKSIPRSDPRILGAPFDQQDQGARKAAMPKITKSDLTIVHVNKK